MFAAGRLDRGEIGRGQGEIRLRVEEFSVLMGDDGARSGAGEAD